ncbi:maltotransferase domain-containing protein, partial [Streptomyces sp. Wh19]|uniref:maltotransferase domain-containing protein n=1 Tax=Streptomyces sp. Wh19 TaxID=3076629 RepID=UPI003FA37F63
MRSRPGAIRSPPGDSTPGSRFRRGSTPRSSWRRAPRWTYTVEAWSDPVATWRQHAGIKIPAGIDTALVLAEGAALY